MLTVAAQGQERKTVRGAVGKGYSTDMKDAYRQARMNAQDQAYKQAGGYDVVHSVAATMLSTNSNELNYFDQYMEIGTVMMDAYVQITKEDSVCTFKNGLIECVVTIDAKVDVGDKRDETFTFILDDNIKKGPVFRDNDVVSFTVIPNQDCYLRVVAYNGMEGAESKCQVIYPEFSGQDGKLKKGTEQKVRFGIQKEYNNINVEQLCLFVIIHKKDIQPFAIPYEEEKSVREFWHWYTKSTKPSNTYMEMLVVNVINKK